MATKKLEALALKGERLVGRLVHAKVTAKNAPFDVVDFTEGVAYEVKTVSNQALTGSNKIHIENGAWSRKMAFLDEYGLQAVLMVVVITSRSEVSVYRTELKQHLRISSVIKNGIKVS